ncbi:MAG: hypothetical protein ACFCD0_20250 [Gemmataceae bacterium]
MQRFTLTTLSLMFAFSISIPYLNAQTMPTKLLRAPRSNAPKADPQGSARVQIAILLDTSGSMRGLIDQARCQIWNVVNTLADARRGGKRVTLQVAVYEYGSGRQQQSNGYIRQVTNFTDDLDEVSRALFSLHAGGSKEYCGQVIRDAVGELNWDQSPSVYKAIFIAGNEQFDQGAVTFGSVLPKLRNESIVLNATYCGSRYSGKELWEAAAKAAGGTYTVINHNHKIPNLSTPMDPDLRKLNRQMSETFVWYGPNAGKAKKNQEQQDKNAARMSDQAFASRMATKIGHLYIHVQSDLIDAIQHGHVELDNMPERKMPESLQRMTAQERKRFVAKLTKRRDEIRRKMATVIANRQRFLNQKMNDKANGEKNASQAWGEALTRIVRGQASARGYTWTKDVTQN